MDDTNPQTARRRKHNQVQNQVNEAEVILKDTVDKVVERGERLDDLIGRTDDLQTYAASFQRKSTRVARTYWWKKYFIKIMIAIGVIVLVILLILIIVILIILIATVII